MSRPFFMTIALVGGMFLATAAQAEEPAAVACTLAGPQSPRHVDAIFDGTNSKAFTQAPPSSALNLCNVHYHVNAEHRSFGYVNKARNNNTGYECSTRNYLSASQTRSFAYYKAVAGQQPRANPCEGANPGDSIEVHWVFTSCPATPGPSLAACSAGCGTAKPVLRVESQVFLLINNDENEAGLKPRLPSGIGRADSFAEYGQIAEGSPVQPVALPEGPSVSYPGSTTGEAYNTSDRCSPTNVTWNVRTNCRTLDIRTLNDWCAKERNVFRKPGEEKIEGHPARALVESKALLSKF